MKMKSTQAAPLDPITALHTAIVQAAEQNWQWHAVSEAERAHLRPGVAAQAKAVSDKLRTEYAMRGGAER